MFLLTGCVILAVGIFMFIKGWNQTNDLRRYEEENLNTDGTVYFANIHASRTHGANKNLYLILKVMGFFTSIFGLIFIGYGLNIFINQL